MVSNQCLCFFKKETVKPFRKTLTVSTEAMEEEDLEGALFLEMLRRPRKKSEKDLRPGSDEADEPRFRSSMSSGPVESALVTSVQQ